MATNTPTTKAHAVRLIVHEAYKERRTKAGLRTIRQACKVLGLTSEEMLEVEISLEYRDDNGNLYDHFFNV